MASARECAAHLFLTETRFREFMQKGVIPKVKTGQHDLDKARKAYILHLRERAAGRATGEAGLDLTAERARLAKEQADGTAIKNAVLRGDYLPANDVERRWAQSYRQIQAGMLSVASRVSQRLGHLTLHDVDTIDREIRAALTEIVDANIGAGRRPPSRDPEPEAATEAGAFDVDRDEFTDT